MKFFIKVLEKNNTECITEYNFYRLFNRQYSLGFTQPLPISVETDATTVPDFRDGLVMIFNDEKTKNFIKSQILLNKDFMFTCKEIDNIAPYLIKTDECIIVTEEAFESYLCSLDDSFDLSTPYEQLYNKMHKDTYIIRNIISAYCAYRKSKMEKLSNPFNMSFK